ncbi:MAG: UDP-glucose--hexose-1-phosphate uridylyltransferase [Clostridiales bacterium]|nr:UDP-glucose--hexose-1-phosphate uridylyltransferase [Clostridiales bacterium]
MIQESIQSLIDYDIREKLIEPEDEIVIRNALMEALKLESWDDNIAPAEEIKPIDDILSELIKCACDKGIIRDTANSRDAFDTKLMGIVTPFPREVIKIFNKKYKASPKEATDWYYDFCKKLNYVRAGRIAKDKRWKFSSDFGSLDISINLSKPEKDPKDIAARGAAKSTNYPKCQLCCENAGFPGNSRHPSRYNLRPVPVSIQEERWHLQYSPYGYYNEHCILFNEKHVPMIIDKAVFEKLLDAVDLFPHYFFGSNADLPIVGGSILSHEHFQGGSYTFPVENAPVIHRFSMSGFPGVSCGIVKWYMSVIRLDSPDRNQLSSACNKILTSWRSYSDESAGIYAYTGDTPHNTITPIIHRKGGLYVCDLVLRNNRTTAGRPLGLFHPNPSLHHIKKENIGLIEVMGLAILPSRLEGEMKALKECILNKEDLEKNPLTAPHAVWAKSFLRDCGDFTEETADGIIENEIGKVFEQVLTDAGVFKQTETGKNAFLKFINNLL